MKFVKTAVAVAIAGIAAAPMIASADTTLSGVVQVKVQGTDVDDDDPDTAAGDVRVGVVSEHELNSGLTGYGSIKLTLDDLLGENGGMKGVTVPGNPTESGEGTTQNIDGTVKADDIYVGIKGGFGDFRWGEIPLAVEYGQLANDIHDVAGDIGDGMSYTGSFGPASVALNYSLEEDSDALGAGVKFNFAGATIGVGFEDRADETSIAAGVSYAIAGFSIAAQYWAKDGDFEFDSNPDAGIVDTSNLALDDNTNIAVKVSYAIAGVNAAVTFSVNDLQAGVVDETTGVASTADSETTVIRLDLGYDLGGGMDVSTRIDSTSVDTAGTDDVLAYRVMLTKAF